MAASVVLAAEDHDQDRDPLILTLQIAGGILLTLLVVAALPYVIGNLGRLAGAVIAVVLLIYLWSRLSTGV